MDFQIDFLALLALPAVAALFYYLKKWKNHFAEPHLYFSDVKAFEGSSDRKISGALSKNLLLSSLIFFLLAFINPRFFTNREHDLMNNPRPPTEGIGIYLILDQSGSMVEEVFAGGRSIKKVNLLKEVTRQFIMGDPKLGLKGRPNDMIGLISFARGAHVMSPLTLDHASLLSELSTFGPVGERDQDGTSIGYAIYKTASMIAATRHYAEDLISKGEPAYTIKSTVMILITDGLQDPNPLDKGKRLRNIDIPEAAAYAKEQGVRLYIVNVEPKLATEEFTPYRHIMERAATLTGGKFYMVDGSTNLEGIYREIDRLEKSELPEEVQALNKDQRPDLYRRSLFYPYLTALGLLLLLASLFAETVLFRRVP